VLPLTTSPSTVMALRRAHRVTSDEVEKVQIVTIPFAVRWASRPGELLAARFSSPGGGAALVRGRTDPSSFDAQASPTSASARSRAGSRSDRSPMTPRAPDIPTARAYGWCSAARDVLEQTATVVAATR